MDKKPHSLLYHTAAACAQHFLACTHARLSHLLLLKEYRPAQHPHASSLCLLRVRRHACVERTMFLIFGHQVVALVHRDRRFLYYFLPGTAVVFSIISSVLFRSTDCITCPLTAVSPAGRENLWAPLGASGRGQMPRQINIGDDLTHHHHLNISTPR